MGRPYPIEGLPSGGWCPACGKLSYATVQDASKAISLHRPGDRRGMRPYRCSEGAHWHIGHAREGRGRGAVPRDATARQVWGAASA